MSLLDGLKEQLKNPLADNNEEIEFALESDFEVALEKAIDVKLSPADIAAILNGDDDIDDDEDDLDDPDDDIDKDYIKDLEGCKEALESTMTELGIDTAADELDADDSDLEMDPEEDNEVISSGSYSKETLRYVDLVIPENNWEQKIQDIKDYKIDVVVMGDDWAGSDKFDYLKDYCEVVFLERTPGVSTTMIKQDLQLQETLDGVDQVPRT